MFYREQNHEKEKKMKKQRTLGIVDIMIFVITMILLAIWIWTGYKNQAKQETKQQEMKQEVYYIPTAGISAEINKMLKEEADENPEVSIEANEQITIASALSGTDEDIDVLSRARNEMIKVPTTYEYAKVEKTLYVNTPVLNVRSEPNKGSKVIHKLPVGTDVETTQKVTQRKGEDKSKWYEIKLSNGETGYVSAKYLDRESPLIYLGDYRLTFYCPCEICCEKYAYSGKTASGNKPVAGVTVAADPSIPFGTRLLIDGHEYIVHDRGGAIKGNHIDIYCNTHAEALSMRNHIAAVYKIK